MHNAIYIKIDKIPDLPNESLIQSHGDLCEYSGLPKSTFIICSSPRCGSSYFGSLISSTKILGQPNEYLHQSVHIPFLSHRWGIIKHGKVNLHEYIASCFRYRTTKNGVFGLKSHWTQFQPMMANNFLQQYFNKTKFIIIKRRDLLGQAISFEIANQTGQWSHHWKSKCIPQYSQENIHKLIINILNQNAGWHHFFAINDLEWMEIFYEDLLFAPDKIIKSVIKHVLPDCKIDEKMKLEPSKLKKQRNQINQAWRMRFIKETGCWL